VFSYHLVLFALFNCLIFKELRRLATAFIYYHIINYLSTPFFKYFLNFLFGVGRSLTTCISYHLSTLYVNRFLSIFPLIKLMVFIFRFIKLFYLK